MPHTSKTLQEAFHYLWPDEVDALKKLANMLPENPIVVNIGAGAGTSGLAFAESREDLRLYTVDIRRESSPLGCLVAEEQVLREAGFDVDSYTSRFIQYNMDSKELGIAWTKPIEAHGFAKPLVDMVFIDGDHSYEGCRGDIEAWVPNLKPDGILAIHDYKKAEAYKRDDIPANVPHPKPWPGVDQAVDEFMAFFNIYIDVVLQVDTLIAFKVIL